MGYYTNCICRVIGGSQEQHDSILEAVKDRYIGCYGSDEVAFETQHYWNKDDIKFLKTLSRDFPGVIIEVSGRGDEDGDAWMRRFRDGKMEEIRMDEVWPDFKEILTDEEKKGKPSAIDSLRDQFGNLEKKAEETFRQFIKESFKGMKSFNIAPYTYAGYISSYYFYDTDRHGDAEALEAQSLTIADDGSVEVEFDTNYGDHFGTRQFPSEATLCEIMDLMTMLEDVLIYSKENDLPLLEAGQEFEDDK